MKHTQGEWKIGNNEIFRPASSGSISPYHKQICSFVNSGTEECKANAKLIAAAPDLLNALIYLEDYVRRELTVVHELKQNEIDFILNQPRSAIQKATA